MRIGSLFSGAGGLDMAVQSVFGGDIVWHSEIDKAASKVLAHRFPGVPNLGSVTEIDWATVEPVDVLCGGFPCQDVSAAGKRAGIKDGTRSGLWAVFADAIDALRPQYVVIENVRGLLSATAHRAVESDDAVVGDRASGPVLRAAGAVLGDLADLGMDARWATVSAASVGAPHRRERVFIVATDAECARQQRHLDDARGRQSDAAGSGGRCEPEGSGKALEGGAQPLGAYVLNLRTTVSLLPTPTAVTSRNATSGRKPDAKFSSGTTLDDVAYINQWGKYAAAIARWEQVAGPAPAPTEPNRNNKPRLNPAFSEWMMGWPAGWVTDPAIGISRNDQLRIVGNGVCSQQAVAALRYLLAVTA